MSPMALHDWAAQFATKENCLMQDLPAETTRDLFTPIEVGPLTLRNRIVMAPLTRSRAGPGNVPTLLSALYYAQRVSAGLIISEATQVAREGQGYISTPGIYSAEQVAGWKCVTSAVHACGGRMVLQLWHVGRSPIPPCSPAVPWRSRLPPLGRTQKPSRQTASRRSPRHARLRHPRSPASSRSMRKERGTRLRPASTVSRYMARTDI